MKKLIAIAAVSSAMFTPLYANDNTEKTDYTADTRGFLGMGIAEGGEKLYSADFTNGDTGSIDSGSGIWFEGGFRTQFENWALKGSLAYKFDSINASNGDFEFTRMPINFVSQFSSGDHNFGAGVTYELNPKLNIDVPGERLNVDFDNASGFLVEYEQLNNEWSWGLRYTMIDYKVGAFEMDGNNVSLFGNWYF